ncbi:hypothetical protein D3105_07630 [Streptomyces globisporus]|uniref:Uncharacterized protein n=1 Tax=Streptomyces globisporus TaxID=1908 RepID=A0A423V3C6_STRGL|nr:hypothetical protein D3105_07630 [Streptomyces globisporus]
MESTRCCNWPFITAGLPIGRRMQLSSGTAISIGGTVRNATDPTLAAVAAGLAGEYPHVDPRDGV